MGPAVKSPKEETLGLGCLARKENFLCQVPAGAGQISGGGPGNEAEASRSCGARERGVELIAEF